MKMKPFLDVDPASPSGNTLPKFVADRFGNVTAIDAETGQYNLIGSLTDPMAAAWLVIAANEMLTLHARSLIRHVRFLEDGESLGTGHGRWLIFAGKRCIAALLGRPSLRFCVGVGLPAVALFHALTGQYDPAPAPISMVRHDGKADQPVFSFDAFAMARCRPGDPLSSGVSGDLASALPPPATKREIRRHTHQASRGAAQSSTQPKKNATRSAP